MTKIKICGLRRTEDIEMANQLRPDFVGFIIDFPKSHRNITPSQLRELVTGLSRDCIKTVGVFVDEDIQTVIELLNEGVIDMAQLHGNEDEDYIKQVQNQTGKPVIKAFAIKDVSVLERAAKCCADHILLDQGKGQGKTFDWSLLGSKQAIETFGNEGIPVGQWFLAGGLDAGNIKEAIQRFHPYALDLSSAVETDKVKDPIKVKEIIDIVRGN